MSDLFLLQSQIKESCRLALPNGLKELMCDISREVLRAQPQNLYDFITKYLAALLVSRENLSIASHLCKDVCDPSCNPELGDELKNIGLEEEDAAKAKKVIEEYFEAGRANESNLMVKLLKRFSISHSQLELVQEAVRKAFIEHHINNTDNTLRELPLHDDEISNAAKHTLQLYAETGPSEELYHQKATRIQSAYRAYGVRRLCRAKPMPLKDKKNIRFHAEHVGAKFRLDGSSETDVAESSTIVHYDPTKFSVNHEALSQQELYKDTRHERILSHTNYDMSLPERVQSFINYEKEREKLKPHEKPVIPDDDSSEDNDEHKSSIISEVHFSEPVISGVISKEIEDQTLPESESKASTSNNEDPQNDNEQIIVDDELEIIDDEAVNAGNESDELVEENINEFKSVDEFVDIDDVNSGTDESTKKVTEYP